MNEKVYVTYENSLRANVSGVYTSRTLAEKEQKERKDLGIIDTFELKNNSYKFKSDSYINDLCKYYKKRLNTIRELISCLYELDGCVSGGIGHVVIDEDNIDNDTIESVIKLCQDEEYKDREEAGLVDLICKELLKLNIQERTLLFGSFYSYGVCKGDCSNCPIENGDIGQLQK